MPLASTVTISPLMLTTASGNDWPRMVTGLVPNTLWSAGSIIFKNKADVEVAVAVADVGGTVDEGVETDVVDNEVV